MFQPGDKVIYGIHGVCCVLEREEKEEQGISMAYLVLQPAGQDGSRYYIPEGNPAAMAKLHKVLTIEDLEQLLQSERVHSDGWIAEENLRKQTYRSLISSGNREKLLQMLWTLYGRKTEMIRSGRKIHQCDENFMRDAERLLISEIALVMDMTQDQAKHYLREKLKEDA